MTPLFVTPNNFPGLLKLLRRLNTLVLQDDNSHATAVYRLSDILILVVPSVIVSMHLRRSCLSVLAQQFGMASRNILDIHH